MELKNLIDINNHQKTAFILGTSVDISPERSIYNAVKRKYSLLSEEAAERFRAAENGFEDIHDYITNAPGALVYAVEGIYSELIQDAISAGIYNIDKDMILREMFSENNFADFEADFNSVLQSYNNIFLTAGDIDFYRSLKFSHPSKQLFTKIDPEGIDGWLKQFRTALSFGISTSDPAPKRVAAMKQFDCLFKNKKLRENIINSVYSSCCNLHTVLINAVKRNSPVSIDGRPDESSAAKAKATFKNYISLDLPPDKKIVLLKEALNLDPYNKDFYFTLIKKFGDKDGKIAEFAELFVVDCRSVKNKILSEYAIANLGKTEEDAEKCAEGVKGYADEIGLELDKITEAFSVIDIRRDKLDQDYRTVDGILFDTRELADTAKKELSEIRVIMANIQPPSPSSTLRYEKDLILVKDRLEHFTTTVKQKYISQADSFLNQFNYIFTEGGALSREQKGQRLAYNFVCSLPLNSYEDVENAKIRLNAMLPEFGIDLNQAVQAIQFLNGRELQLNTVDGLAFASREQADMARKELVTINNIMQGVQPPSENSLLSYEKKLLEIRGQLAALTSPIKERYINIINSYLGEFDVMFRQMGSFGIAQTREEAARYKADCYVRGFIHEQYSYSDIDNAYASLQAFLPELGLNINQAAEAMQFLQQMENNLNTVDGIIFNSRDSARLGREELAQISAIMNTIQPPTNDSLLDYEQNVIKAGNEINGFQTNIKLKYLDILRHYLADFDEKFRRVSLVKTAATREEAAQQRALKYVKSLEYNTLNDVNMAKAGLTNLLPYLGINFQQANEAVAYVLEMESRLTMR